MKRQLAIGESQILSWNADFAYPEDGLSPQPHARNRRGERTASAPKRDGARRALLLGEGNPASLRLVQRANPALKWLLGPGGTALICPLVWFGSGCFRTPLDESAALRAEGAQGMDAAFATSAADRGVVAALDGSAGLDEVRTTSGFCMIDGKRYEDGRGNPRNACQSCRPATSVTRWSEEATTPGCIAAGNAHTCAVHEGSVWCWGANYFSQVGRSTWGRPVLSPSRVQGLHAGASAVAAAFSHTCAIVNGSVFCWGANGIGQLGNGTTTATTVPTPVSGIRGEVQSIVAGPLHTCALAEGSVWCWGQGGYGKLGDAVGAYSAFPVEVKGLPAGVIWIAVGDSHSCAATTSGVWCWGDKTFGQLGGPHSPDSMVAGVSVVPVRIGGLPDPIEGLIAGQHGSCTLTSGKVMCWGSHIPGGVPMGLGISLVGFPSGVRFIAGRMHHVCGVMSAAGDVLCVGDNKFGDLGDGSNKPASTPVAVMGEFWAVTALAAGDFHTCAMAAGGVWCWGQNSEGQLGDGTRTDSLKPTRVVGFP